MGTARPSWGWGWIETLPRCCCTVPESRALPTRCKNHGTMYVASSQPSFVCDPLSTLPETLPSTTWGPSGVGASWVSLILSPAPAPGLPHSPHHPPRMWPHLPHTGAAAPKWLPWPPCPVPSALPPAAGSHLKLSGHDTSLQQPPNRMEYKILTGAARPTDLVSLTPAILTSRCS